MLELNLTNELIVEMAKIGVLYGHKKTKTHPKMKQFIGANRNEIEIFKPEAVIDSLKKAIDFLRTTKINKGIILAIGTNAASKEIIKKFAAHFNFPYINTRWLGGTLTNLKIIRERINYYKALQKKKETGELLKYTKKERFEFDKELKKLSEKFDGLVLLERLPDAVLIINPTVHLTAVREANRMKIPVVALMDNSNDPQKIEYPIIANDHARSGIVWIMNKIIEGIGEEEAEPKLLEQPEGESTSDGFE